MDKRLLLKEQEYYEINKKLDQRSKELLAKIDNIKKSDVDGIFRACSVTEGHVTEPPKESKELHRSVSASNPSIARLTNEELKAFNLPEDINHVGAKGFVHILKSKVKQLQFELDKVTKDHREKSEEVRILQKEKVKLQEDKEKFLQQSNIARCQITKMEAQLTMSQSKLQGKEAENLALTKEIDGLNRELKAAKSSAQCGDVRYQRALEELAKLKTTLRSMQQNEKDIKSAHRKHSNSLTDSIKRLEKQKIELQAGFKKQHVLIDNLRQQKLHIEAANFTEKAEADFIKLVTEGELL